MLTFLLTFLASGLLVVSGQVGNAIYNVEEPKQDAMIQELISLSSNLHNKLSSDPMAQNVTEVLRRMTLTMADSKPGDSCLAFKMTSGPCVVEFKIAHPFTVVPVMMTFLPKVHNCPSLVKAFLPVLYNPCFCTNLSVHPTCPGFVHEMMNALKIMC